MALARDVYRALEDVVGTENISDELAILDSYAFQWLGELMPGAKDRFTVRPEAVVLPGSTEEVQAIVRACNRYKIKFKAFSTGWGMFGKPGSAGVIQLDMRRMNRILEINEQNMFAVVEPYVIGAQLQAELMKRGLNCQIITAGSNVSALPLAAMSGDGYSSVSTSTHGRNTLSVEWVLPTGEILKLGSLGSGGGWFCGDGPGPSLRGVIRGRSATAGGLGVFTKAATKLYHWPGPQVPQIEGVSPHYSTKSLSEMHCHYPVFPSWEKMAEAGIKIAESEIAYILLGMRKVLLAADTAISNEEGAELYSRILREAKGRPGLFVILQATSRRESDYQENVLKQILACTDGEYLSFVEEENLKQGMIWRFTRVSAGSRHYLRFAGGLAFIGDFTSWQRVPKIRGGEANKARQKYIQSGLILYDDGDGGVSTCMEYGHMGVSGVGGFYDPADPESIKAANQMSVDVNNIGLEKYMWIPSSGPHDHDKHGPLQSNYHLWLKKIKGIFDPNMVSDPGNYISQQGKIKESHGIGW
jgi:glycolate oxidase